MTTATVYHYDYYTGELLGTSEAQESPREPGEFLVPAFATLTPPPNAPTGKRPLWTTDKWILADTVLPAAPKVSIFKRLAKVLS